MNRKILLRQIHQWTSTIFAMIVALIFIVMGLGQEPAAWVYFLPLPPLAVLMLTGLYMFFLPYASKRRQARTADA